MRRLIRRAVPGTVTALIVVLSGCAGASGDAQQDEPTLVPSAAPAEVSSETGGIEGTVTDDQIAPIQGAQVALPSRGLETTTDAEGRFSFSNVPPGSHQVLAARLGYTSGGKLVTVVAGEVATVGFQLAPIEIEEAYYVTLTGNGRIGCGVAIRPGTAAEACAATYGTPASITDAFRVDFKLTAANVSKIKMLVFETTWRSTQAFAGALDIYWETYQEWGAGTLYTEGAPKLFNRTFGKSPLKGTADEDQIAAAVKPPGYKHCVKNKECWIYARAFPYAGTLGPGYPVDVSVYIDQPFTHFVTEFYGEVAPEDFTVIKDN